MYKLIEIFDKVLLTMLFLEGNVVIGFVFQFPSEMKSYKELICLGRLSLYMSPV